MSKWELIRNFVNSNSEIFTTKDVRTYVDLKTQNITKYTASTESQYVLHMMHCGFIKRLSRGKYQRQIMIPEFVSSTLLQTLAYDKGKRDDFMRKFMRKQKLILLNDQYNIT